MTSLKPFANISPNASREKNPQSIAQETLPASARVSQNIRSAPTTVDFDMDPNSSDSSYERHMLEQIRLHRETMIRNGKQVPFSRASRYDPSRFNPNRFNQSSDSEELGRRTVALPRSPDQASESQRHAPAMPQRQPNAPLQFAAKAHRYHETLERWQRSRALQSTPVVQDSPDYARHPADAPLPSVEESPLSRKSSTRGTPASQQAWQKKAPNSFADSLLGDEVITSTPAFRRRLFGESEKEEEDESRMSYPTPPPESRPYRRVLPPIRPLPGAMAAAIAAASRARPTSPPKPAGSGEHATEQPRQRHGRMSKQKTTADGLPQHAVQRPKPEPIPEPQNKSPRQAAQPPREDVRDLLRQLSRSVSSTPSPALAGRSRPAEPERPTNSRPLEAPNGPAREARSKTDNKSSAKSSAEQASASREARNDPLSSKPSSLAQTATPAVSKTPRVIGGGVGTPAEEKVQKTVAGASQAKKDPKLPVASSSTAPRPFSPARSGGTLPKSALSAVVDRAKSRPATEKTGFGESTIHSLEDILSDDEVDTSDLDVAVPLSKSRLSSEDQDAVREILEHRIAADLPFSGGLPPTAEERRLIREVVDRRMTRGREGEARAKAKARDARPAAAAPVATATGAAEAITPRRKGRMMEELQLERMSEHVNAMESRARSLNAGLGRLERKISGGGSVAKAAACRHCECPGKCYGAHPFRALGRSVMAGFCSNRDGRWGLTWLGMAMAVLVVWLAVEVAVCWSVCSPLFAGSVADGFGPFTSEEEASFGITSALYYPLLSALNYPLGIVLTFYDWVSSIVEPFWSDHPLYSQGLSRAAKATGTVASRILEGDWSMDGDEVI